VGRPRGQGRRNYAVVRPSIAYAPLVQELALLSPVHIVNGRFRAMAVIFRYFLAFAPGSSFLPVRPRAPAFDKVAYAESVGREQFKLARSSDAPHSGGRRPTSPYPLAVRVFELNELRPLRC
jgi:hypothetical protein